MLDYEAELGGAVDPDGTRLTVPAEWEGIPGTAFGGFVAAAVLVAASTRTQHPRPLSLFARFYRPVPLSQPVELELVSERRGRTVETIAGKLILGDRLLATFSVAFGREGEAPLSSQAVSPMAPLVRPRAIWKHLEDEGFEASPMMRRVGFRGETEEVPDSDVEAGWHLRSEWPATTSRDLAVRAAVSLMPIDSFVGPATMRANGVDLDAPWPVIVPSLDLTGWFYNPEAPAPPSDGNGVEEDETSGWLSTRTSVPVSWAGYAVGRTQVWAGDALMAEGMSQVALIPVPPATPVTKGPASGP